MIVFDSAVYLLFSSLLIDFYLLIKKKYNTVKEYKKIYIDNKKTKNNKNNK